MTAARLLDCSADEYHSLPGFSSTLAKEVISKSPLHAKAREGKKPSKLLDRGNVIHRLVLGKGKDYEVLNFSSYNTNASKEARDKARKDGRVPVLAHDFEEHCIAAEKIRVGLVERGIVLDGASEVAIEWTEQTSHGPVLCRGMFDHLWLDEVSGEIFDLKVTENAAPDAIERTAENLGYAIQWSAYTRALTALRPDLAGRIKFMFAFCEPDAPHAMNLCETDGPFRNVGEQRWLRAVSTWAKCTAENKWPGYGAGINYLRTPPWALSKEAFTAEEM